MAMFARLFLGKKRFDYFIGKFEPDIKPWCSVVYDRRLLVRTDAIPKNPKQNLIDVSPCYNAVAQHHVEIIGLLLRSRFRWITHGTPSTKR